MSKLNFCRQRERRVATSGLLNLNSVILSDSVNIQRLRFVTNKQFVRNSWKKCVPLVLTLHFRRGTYASSTCQLHGSHKVKSEHEN